MLKEAILVGMTLGTCTASFLSGYFFAKKKIFDQYDVIDNVYDLVAEPKVKKEKLKKEEEFKEVTEEKTPFEGLEIPDISSDSNTTNQYKKAFSDYAKLGRDPRVKENKTASVDYREPYLITEDDFENSMKHFDKVFIEYFEDGVFIDEKTDEPDPAVEKYLGENINDAFGYGTDNEDIVHVRNERISADYCITRKHQTYASYIGSV